jgi:diketogulonate reductase-like aldo/keto reductase
MKTLKLNNKTYIPVLGFGTWKLTGKICEKSVEVALQSGYRHIDTADRYGNHKDIAKVLKSCGLKREELFITSKLWLTDLHYKDAIDAGKKILDELGIEYLDLFLIHWPDRTVPIDETLEAINDLKEADLVNTLGVSNFTINHLKDALKTGVEITNNQVEFHPTLNQKELKQFCDENNIVITAYSPLAFGQELELESIKKLAQKYEVSAAQVILNWIISKNIVTLTKSSNPDHIKDNFKTLSWNLSEEDILEIDKLNTKNRVLLPEFHDFNY